jgi:hypothetical protein
MVKKIRTSKGEFDYEISNLPDKKLMTKVNGKTVHFGAAGYQHYHDRTGLLPVALNHGDEKRRKSYLARSGGIKLGSGKLAKDDPSSPTFHAREILW